MAERKENGQFQKGHALAPGGARAGSGRKPDAVKQTNAQLLEETVTPADRKAILKAMIEQAKLGDVRAAVFVFDRLFGKPKEQVEVTDSRDNIPPTSVIITDSTVTTSCPTSSNS